MVTSSFTFHFSSHSQSRGSRATVQWETTCSVHYVLVKFIVSLLISSILHQFESPIKSFLQFTFHVHYVLLYIQCTYVHIYTYEYIHCMSSRKMVRKISGGKQMQQMLAEYRGEWGGMGKQARFSVARTRDHTRQDRERQRHTQFPTRPAWTSIPFLPSHLNIHHGSSKCLLVTVACNVISTTMKFSCNFPFR